MIIENYFPFIFFPDALEIHTCLTLWDPMDCSPPGSSVHGISQARILEWVATPFSRESSWPRDPTQVSCIAVRFFYHLSHQGRYFNFLIVCLISYQTQWLQEEHLLCAVYNHKCLMSWWWTGKTGVLQSMGSQRVRHNWATELTDQNLQTQDITICLSKSYSCNTIW